MHHRAFYVALGVPKGAPMDTVRIAYRKIVTRYRRALDDEAEEAPTQPPLFFGVLRS